MFQIFFLPMLQETAYYYQLSTSFIPSHLILSYVISKFLQISLTPDDGAWFMPKYRFFFLSIAD